MMCSASSCIARFGTYVILKVIDMLIGLRRQNAMSKSKDSTSICTGKPCTHNCSHYSPNCRAPSGGPLFLCRTLANLRTDDRTRQRG